ncbi:MAG TPA: alanine dehydrogenase, partial [Rhodothermales bacterium]|nr:alanine dehydrogenase [Rhodothermales bacterium]
MEISSIQGFTIEQGVLTLEKTAQKQWNENQLKIGIPKETAAEEQRVAVTPEGVETLINAGHAVFVEKGAGEAARFGDDLYLLAGAQLANSAADLYAQAQLIAKMFPPTGEELRLLQDRQILISALHLGSATAGLIQQLMTQRITAIGFEFIRDPDGTFPIVRMMHEITGALSI